jgi:peptidyl-prolyl cis-trans isomerase D
MLDKLRANKGGLVTWIFLVAIIAVFVLYFGPGSFAKSGGGCGGPPASYAARVNGQVVPAAELERTYSQLLRMYQQQMGQALSREMADQLGLRNVALEQVIGRVLVTQEAARLGIVVSDDEISDVVVANPQFQMNGAFDPKLYDRATAASFGSNTRYEALLREDLLHQKMLATVRETVKVSEGELRAAWQSDRDRASLAFLQVPLATARAEVKPTEAELKAFAAASAAKIEAFYKENAARYDTAKRVRARHVLARVAPGAPAGDDEAARKRVEAAADRVRKGEDFAKVAAEVSDDTNTRSRGGELGFLTEAMVEPGFAQAAFSLQAGQLSDPVRTGTGWHVIQVEEVVPARKIPLEQVRIDIARELLVADRALALADGAAREALAEARKGERKPVKLGTQQLAWQETGAFPVQQGTIVPKLGPVPGLLEAARAAKTGDVLPAPFASQGGPVVAVVLSREHPDPAAFAAERPTLALRVEARKESQVERDWMKQLRDAAKVEVNEAVVAGMVPAQD